MTCLLRRRRGSVLLRGRLLLADGAAEEVETMMKELGGSHNLPVDQEAGRAIEAVEPNAGVFARDAEDPLRVDATLRDALAPGSYFVLSHATSDDKPAEGQVVEKAYNRTVSTPMRLRTHREILEFFDGFQVVDPGLVSVPLWRPDSPETLDGFWGTVAGVARPPARGCWNLKLNAKHGSVRGNREHQPERTLGSPPTLSECLNWGELAGAVNAPPDLPASATPADARPEELAGQL